MVLLCGLAGPSRGQSLPTGLLPRTHRFAYTAVVPVEGVSQADLVLRARAWAQQVTPAGQFPVSTHGPDTEVVRTTGVCPLAYDWAGNKLLMSALRYTVTISVRKGRYQYEVKDFFFVNPGSDRSPVSETPAETYFNGNFIPYNETAARFNGTMRTCFKEVTTEVLAHLQEGMRKAL
ncbi:hypothetical protein ACFQT0_21125 [Hymenobacter humi]|uniref:DUF4468 domain-containing protein n=1 Tax=Hymenobacter humi TaxID=1411620 RepID=A0ABW2U7W1_9BACT